VLEGPDNRFPRLRVVAGDELRPGVALGHEPDEGLAAELGLSRVIGLRVVLPLAGSGQCCGASGVVAVRTSTVVGEFRVGLERLGPEPGGSGIALRIVAYPP
jgi:hypothetical protein